MCDNCDRIERLVEVMPDELEQIALVEQAEDEAFKTIDANNEADYVYCMEHPEAGRVWNGGIL